MAEEKKCIICKRDKSEFGKKFSEIKYQLSFESEGLCPDCTDLLNGDIKREDVNWLRSQ